MWLLAKSPSEVANTVVGNTPYHTQLTPHHILEHCSAEPGGHFVTMWRNAFLISLLLPSAAKHCESNTPNISNPGKEQNAKLIAALVTLQSEKTRNQATVVQKPTYAVYMALVTSTFRFALGDSVTSTGQVLYLILEMDSGYTVSKKIMGKI